MPGAKTTVDGALDLIQRKAPSIRFDQELLEQKLSAYQAELKTTDPHDQPTLEQRIHLCEQILRSGAASEYGLTRSGRAKSSNLASPLNTSKREGKYGHDFWEALDGPLSELDLRSADLQFAAILSGDSELFKQVLGGDPYTRGAVALDLCAEDESLDRDAPLRTVLKRLTLATLYGAGVPCLTRILTEAEQPEAEQLAGKYREYLGEAFPQYTEWSGTMTRIGMACCQKRSRPPLPNGLPLILRTLPNGQIAGYATAALMIQSTTAWATADILLKLEDAGADPIFNIHDAVVTRSEIADGQADAFTRAAVGQVLETFERDWTIPEETKLYGLEKLEFAAPD